MSRVQNHSSYRADERVLAWSGTGAAITVLFVPGSDADRLAYRRRLGHAIAQIRDRARSMSQEDLADAMKVDKNTISRWENARTEPKAYDLSRLAEVLEVPGDWLLRPTDSINEMDLRLDQLQRAAGLAETAQADAAVAVRARGAAAGRASARGKRSA